MKTYNGKALYQPAGKAGEYAKWGCNFHVGCSNDCTYCYCKKGVLANAMGKKTATLKKCFKDDVDAMRVFVKELEANLDELREHGLFFSFTTDPMLPENMALTNWAAGIAVHKYGVPVKILTKCAGWVDDLLYWLDNSNSDNAEKEWRKNFAFGFTLTGHDELEPGASTNAERIEAMRKLHDAGFRIFASIEPIIDFESSMKMIEMTAGFCDLYKIGLLDTQKVSESFSTELVNFLILLKYLAISHEFRFYLKDSITKHMDDGDSAMLRHRVGRSGSHWNWVGRDYNMFKQ